MDTGCWCGNLNSRNRLKDLNEDGRTFDWIFENKPGGHGPVAYPGILFGGGGSTNSVEDRGQRERGSGGGTPLVRGSGGSCNLVQEISLHIVKLS